MDTPLIGYIPFNQLVEVNPRTDYKNLSADTIVSFIPMADVTESGQWTGLQKRRFEDVCNGYTSFSEGDILFAKITPCMENGKGAHAVGLCNGIGFGSTEFHVLRASVDNCARFVFHHLQTRSARLRAVAFMSGSAGQQRVQADFFSNYSVPSIPSDQQARIAHILDTLDHLIRQTEAW